jgi:murein peptide amidase A
VHAHDPHYLIRRWKAVARTAGLLVRSFTTAGGYSVFLIESRRSFNSPGFYFSAGIHGDEAGGTEGLILWAERSIEFLRTHPVLIFPCLNPWGLVHNMRCDRQGRDLNRCYHEARVRQVAAHMREMRGRRFRVAMALHEDFDVSGIYLYEVGGAKPFWGGHILAAASRFIPVESRARIEGRGASHGLIRRTIRPNSMTEHPEAFYLHFHHSERTFTLETPSEFAIEARAAAHAASLDAIKELACGSIGQTGGEVGMSHK